jgi:hypothetical protein
MKSQRQLDSRLMGLNWAPLLLARRPLESKTYWLPFLLNYAQLDMTAEGAGLLLLRPSPRPVGRGAGEAREAAFAGGSTIPASTVTSTPSHRRNT